MHNGHQLVTFPNKIHLFLLVFFYISVTLFLAGIVPFHCNAVTLRPTVPDNNIKVTVNQGDRTQPVPLNCGDTVVEISVCSADGSVSQVG